MTDRSWLLDTDTLSELVRNPRGSVAVRIAAVAPDALYTSVVVAAELRFGARRKGSPVLSDRVERLLDVLAVLPLDAPVDRHYAEIRHAVESAGTPIGSNDLFIAAHARSLGSTLVSHNLRAFQRVPGLQIEDWLATPG